MSKKLPLFLDANAGLPLAPAALSALAEGGLQARVFNPSSIHHHGRQALRLVSNARDLVCRSIGTRVDPEQILFTSGGTESNQLVIFSALRAEVRASAQATSSQQRQHPVRWLCSPLEHDSVHQMVEEAQELGVAVDYLPVNREGEIAPEAWREIDFSMYALVSILWVNNETGVIQPELAEIVARARAAGAKVHVDAAQAWGKIPMDVQSLGASYVTFSGHKIGGPAGVGFVWVGRGSPIEPLIRGKQEKGRRGGTENTLGICLLGEAAREIPARLALAPAVAAEREALEREILARIPGAVVNGGGARLRASGTTNLGFGAGVSAESLVLGLDMEGFSVSAGAACSSGVLEPSRVLLAMGRTRAEAMGGIRVSWAEPIGSENLGRFVQALEKVVARIRSASAAADPVARKGEVTV